METNLMHTILLDPTYAEQNYTWLKRFVFRGDNLTFVFSCYSYQFLSNGFVEFDMFPKANAERTNILLPARVIVAIFLDDSHKNQFGFLYQEIDHEE